MFSAEGKPGRWSWLVVWSVALAVRLAAAWLIPNAEQDGYSYCEIIRDWSGKLSAGTFRLTDLFGFWLPGFQFVAAVVNLVLPDPLLAGKIICAVSGAISCVVVFALASQVSNRLGAALAAFAIILFNPLHLIYSAAAMTDVPFVALVLTSVFFASKRRWPLAALLVCAAETVRLEAWALLFALPLLQLVVERKVSLTTLLLLALPPLIWLVISRAATGDWLGYFNKRAAYQERFLQSWPSRREFGWSDVNQDFDYLLLGANSVVAAGLVVAGISVLLKLIRFQAIVDAAPLCLSGYAAAIAGFLLLAYLTKRQPVFLPRYGLIFFALGLPLLAWSHQQLNVRLTSRCLTAFVIVLLVALVIRSSLRQLPLLAKVIRDFQAQERIASRLAAVIDSSRCFSDDPAVRVLSGAPAGQFLRSETTPSVARQNSNSFDAYLRESHVEFLVYIETEDSLPVKFHPELARGGEAAGENFRLMDVARSPFGPDVWLYRLPCY